MQNIGIVCGAVSGNLIVVDLDGTQAYTVFRDRFPYLARTYTVLSGSGNGYHVYLYCADLPASTRATGTPLGNIELLSNGKLVAAPPSIHPDTGAPYLAHRVEPIRRVTSLAHVVAWIQTFNQAYPSPQPEPIISLAAPPPAHALGTIPTGSDINPRLIAAIADYFRRLGYRQNKEWLNGQCVYPERHKHADSKPSFGFNTESGWGNCFWCGPILTKDICFRIGINPSDYGGLLTRSPTATQLTLGDHQHSHS